MKLFVAVGLALVLGTVAAACGNKEVKPFQRGEIILIQKDSFVSPAESEKTWCWLRKGGRLVVSSVGNPEVAVLYHPSPGVGNQCQKYEIIFARPEEIKKLGE